MVRDRIGPVAAFKTATVVKRLPKTRSGKILRGRSRRSPTTRITTCRPPSTIRPFWVKWKRACGFKKSIVNNGCACMIDASPQPAGGRRQLL
jgi:hypothetical protein